MRIAALSIALIARGTGLRRRYRTRRTRGLAAAKNVGFLMLTMSRNPKSTTSLNTEASLYLPVKRFLESRGYSVKGEVCGCDLVARRGDEPAVIVELKLRFTLALLLQGVDRLAVSERVYLAVPRPPRRARSLSPEAPAVRRLCRRLGLGLLVVGRQSVTVVEEPVPYRPRLSRQRTTRLIA